MNLVNSYKNNFSLKITDSTGKIIKERILSLTAEDTLIVKIPEHYSASNMKDFAMALEEGLQKKRILFIPKDIILEILKKG